MYHNGAWLGHAALRFYTRQAINRIEAVIVYVAMKHGETTTRLFDARSKVVLKWQQVSTF